MALKTNLTLKMVLMLHVFNEAGGRGASPQQQKGVTLRKCFREPIDSMPGDKKTINKLWFNGNNDYR